MILPPGIATGILSAPKGAPNFEDLAVSLKRYPDTNLRDLTARGLKAIMRCHKFICPIRKNMSIKKRSADAKSHVMPKACLDAKKHFPGAGVELAHSSDRFHIRNRIFGTRFPKPAQAKHTAVTNAAGAIFALIA